MEMSAGGGNHRFGRTIARIFDRTDGRSYLLFAGFSAWVPRPSQALWNPQHPSPWRRTIRVSRTAAAPLPIRHQAGEQRPSNGSGWIVPADVGHGDALVQ